jgi:hypothetical protein
MDGVLLPEKETGARIARPCSVHGLRRPWIFSLTAARHGFHLQHFASLRCLSNIAGGAKTWLTRAVLRGGA